MNDMFDLDLINVGLKTMAMLFVVLGLLVLSLYLMRKYLFLRGRARGDLIIKVLSSLYLSPKDRIEVIDISGEKIVLGITPGNINFLTKLSNSSVTGEIRNENKKDHYNKE